MAIKPDPKNANRGTQRGRGLLEQSLRQYGGGRSILLDANEYIIAGNKTAEVAEELGIPIRVIETDGNELIAVKRTDLDLIRDKAAKELAVADNRVGQVSLDWDTEVLADLLPEVDLSNFWRDDELTLLFERAPSDGIPVDPDAEWVGMPEFYQEDKTSAYQVIVHFARVEDVEAFERLVGQQVPKNTRSIWFPKAERQNVRGLGYVAHES